MKAYHIHIALHHDELGELFALHKVYSVDVMPLVVDKRIPGVHILCAVAAGDYPAAERYDPAACGDHREHEPVMEEIECRFIVLSPTNAKPCIQQLIP